MNAEPKHLVRICPNCRGERPVGELQCENVLDAGICLWLLSDEEIREAGTSSRPTAATLPPAGRRCANGHSLEPGDEICLVCGADAGAALEERPAPFPDVVEPARVPTTFGEWEAVGRLLDPPEAPWERFSVSRASDGRRAVLTLYRPGHEPDPAVHEALRRMDLDHVPELIATGRHGEHAYEVTEAIAGDSLAEAGWLVADDPDALRRIVDEISRALASFAELGLRHRDIRPATILLRTRKPLDLVVTGFGSARLSDFDLEAVAPLELTRYSAPEVIVGAVSAASDWWSLGMLLLEQATRGTCFEGINERAFHLHVVTRGIDLPEGLPPDWRVLLRGLLTRDPLRRWGAEEVREWLDGEYRQAPQEDEPDAPGEVGPTLVLNGRTYAVPGAYALAAAEAHNWELGRDQTLRGALATWLAELGTDPRTVADVRRLSSDDGLTEDFRHALALMVVNPSLPLTVAGAIVTPAWLLAHPAEGYEIVTGDVTKHLERMGREPWLVRLRIRAAAVRERARLLEIELDEDRTRVAVLATSRANLEAERDALRRLAPDTDHAGLGSLVERTRLSDEDLIVLVAAAAHQFVPLAALCDAAREAAARAGATLDEEALPVQLTRPRRELYAEVEDRIANFARCGNERVDGWADAFRIERRLPPARAAVLLALPADAWREPPRQQYVDDLLGHFEKRVSGAVARGPLARFVLGKTTPRLDLVELGTGARSAESLLVHVLSREPVPVSLDPAAYLSDEAREGRLRRLVSHAATFRRDTGIDGRYLGFPFLVVRDGRRDARPRVAPVLLWPVAIDLASGAGRTATLSFDPEREEVRLNPALEGVLGREEFGRWRAARDELLGRPALRPADVVDGLGSLATASSRSLLPVPGRGFPIEPGATVLAPAAALFNAEFVGQAVAEDLRRMRRMPPGGTALDAALRVTGEPPEAVPIPQVPERERYLAVESDPSQEAAVLRSRMTPGLLVEGPPGTGKSQTIVNILCDAIGRGETVLVVCQKQAALKVVRKRMDAEGLGDRLFMVVDTNRDREGIVRALREQVPAARAAPDDAAALQRARDDKAARIEALEGELDRHHAAFHAPDELTGMSYREVLDELIAIRAAGARVDAPDLRALLRRADDAALARAEETCGPLARVWLPARYEGSPLSAVRPSTEPDAAELGLRSALSAFAQAEAERETTLREERPSFEVDDPEAIGAWLASHGRSLASLADDERVRLRRWLDLFRLTASKSSAADGLFGELSSLALALRNLDAEADRGELFAAVSSLDEAALRARLADACRATAEGSIWANLSPARWAARRRSTAFLAGSQAGAGHGDLPGLRAALDLEARLRPLRADLSCVEAALGIAAPPGARNLTSCRGAVTELVAALSSVRDAARAILDCPSPQVARQVTEVASAGGFAVFLRSLASAFARHAARAASAAALDRLTEWMDDAWSNECAGRIARGEAAPPSLDGVLDALGTLASYQRFRARAVTLDATSLAAFAALRRQEHALGMLAAAELDGGVRRTIRHEALLARKGRIEGENPELLFEREETEVKVAALAALDREMRDLNLRLLTRAHGAASLGTQAAWDDLTRLRGPRTRRLREILDRGGELGLMRLRPVWLMSPDVASRVLPLRAGLFDLVVFDEASQMPVEHAAPSLFRARRAVVSGDEKQMPPSSFFTGRYEEDEDEIDSEGPEEAATEAEREAREDAWNRRDVQACPDLLQLARSCLPATTLRIHYRSRYRELIGYSNAAFYKGELSVPVRHPDDEVRRSRPVEVVRVDGVYEAQTNPAEAERVVETLARIWSAPSGKRPSVGVVTFNRKQADLVEDAVEARATVDPSFLAALQRERERTQDGEDMGFFVKNVENVQGDERDVIIFSTTFGRDRRGAFRRGFGVLGQAGGERRLNVAVTRAREKVVLVTSIPVTEVSDWLVAARAPDRPRDYLQAYLDYAAKLSAGDLGSVRAGQHRLGASRRGRAGPSRSAAGVAASVGAYLSEIGFAPVAADDQDDAFGLDFAVEDPRTGQFGIGIECDAPRHPLLERARAREIWRPKVLGRAMPRVHRVSSFGWLTREAEERARLRSAVEDALGRGSVA